MWGARHAIRTLIGVELIAQAVADSEMVFESYSKEIFFIDLMGVVRMVKVYNEMF